MLCEKWVTALQKDYKFEVKKSHRIYSKHFEEQQFIKSTFGNLMLNQELFQQYLLVLNVHYLKASLPNISNKLLCA